MEMACLQLLIIAWWLRLCMRYPCRLYDKLYRRDKTVDYCMETVCHEYRCTITDIGLKCKRHLQSRCQWVENTQTKQRTLSKYRFCTRSDITPFSQGICPTLQKSGENYLTSTRSPCLNWQATLEPLPQPFYVCNPSQSFLALAMLVCFR